MDRWIACAVAVVVAGCGSKQELAASTEDQEAISREIDGFAAAWSQGDAKGAAAFYTEDGLRVGPGGDVEHGRGEVEAAYDKQLHGSLAGAKLTLERGTVRMLRTDLALWQGGLEIARSAASSPLKGYLVQLMKRVNGRWLALEAHPKLFPAPAPPPK
jgi:uncharacterized protein (TIGR02246 family)